MEEEEDDDDGGDWFQAQLNSRWRDYQEERARQEQTKARYTYYGYAQDGLYLPSSRPTARGLSLGGGVGTWDDRLDTCAHVPHVAYGYRRERMRRGRGRQRGSAAHSRHPLVAAAVAERRCAHAPRPRSDSGPSSSSAAVRRARLVSASATFLGLPARLKWHGSPPAAQRPLRARGKPAELRAARVGPRGEPSPRGGPAAAVAARWCLPIDVAALARTGPRWTPPR